MPNRGHTDDEIEDILDQRGLWLIRAGTLVRNADTLRRALINAAELSRQGVPVGQIVKMPNDEIVVSAEQIHRLWRRLAIA